MGRIKDFIAALMTIVLRGQCHFTWFNRHLQRLVEELDSDIFLQDDCLLVLKDLANCLTDMVLLYRVASHRSWKGL